MNKRGWTYKEINCLVCKKPLSVPRPSKLLYHRGKCVKEKILQGKKTSWYKHHSENLKKSKTHYKKNSLWWKKYNKVYRKENPLKIKKWMRDAVLRNRIKWKKMSEYEKEVIRQYQRDYGLRIKKEVFQHYDKSCCRCCGEKRIEFLCIDHIRGGGTKHRKVLKKSGQRFCLWLRANKYPKGYRVLCYNCNQARGFFGFCPHEKE